MAEVWVEIASHTTGNVVRYQWVDRAGPRPPVFILWVQADGNAGHSVEIALSGDEIGRLRLALNNKPEEARQ